ncbi:MAG: hypothetical protein JSR17_07955 [Proteobacteria bacterium]|nr:hypothetical protein [Pseudomonadota bacterium]
MLLKLTVLNTWRQRHHAEFKIMAMALFLAIFSITTLLTLTQALDTAMNKEAATLLGADLLVESPDPLSLDYQQVASEMGLKAANVIDFFSMIMVNDKAELVSISAISGEFPLRGKLSIATPTIQEIQGPPPLGHIYLQDTLALKLNVQINDMVKVGDATLTVAGILKDRPIALSDSSALAPVAYVNAKDLPAMGVLQEGSRATYRLLLAATVEKLSAYKLHFKDNNADITWVSATQNRPAINRVLIVAQRYVAVIILIQFILAGIVIALCAHQYSVRQQKSIAVWKSFGANNSLIIQTQFIALCLMAFIVILFAIVAGYFMAVFLLKNSEFSQAVLKINWQGGALGVISALLILIGFALGPIVALRQVSPMHLLQRQRVPQSRLSWLLALLSVLTLSSLFYFYLQEANVALELGRLILLISILAFALAYIAWRGFEHLNRGPITWRFAITYMVRHKSNSIIQWLVFTLVITFLMLIHIIQKDFMTTWKNELPISTPNYFLLNIQDNQLEALQQWFANKNIKDVHFYPIVRGRMSHINGKSIEQWDQTSENKKGLQRPINLTWMKELPKDNQVVQGVNWQTVQEGQSLISIEEKFSQRQGLKLQDTISFQIADKVITGKIVQIRTVQWESFKPNFFVIFPPKVLDHFSHSYITSIYLPTSEKSNLMSLTKEFVQISIIDIDALIQKAREIINKVSMGITLLLTLVFLLGVLIMYASVLSSLKERLTESAMLQILGANKYLVSKILLIEFGVLGLLAGITGCFMAVVIAKDLAHRFFEMPLTIHYTAVALAVLASTLTVMIFGLIGTRKVFQLSPLWLLRQTN